MFSRAMADILNACIVLAPCGGSGGGIYIYIYISVIANGGAQVVLYKALNPL